MFAVFILVSTLAAQAPIIAFPADAQIQESASPVAGQAPSAAELAQPADPSKQDSKEPPTPEHTGIRALFGNLLEDFKHIPTATNGIIAGGGGVAALAVHPLDQRV